MLIAYVVAVQLLKELRPIVEAIAKHDSNLAGQLRRAATSVVLNLGEGQRRVAGNQRRAFEVAHGEAREALSCLDAADGWGWVVDDRAARKTLDRLLGLCWGLTR
jgi:four helix bundle protein